VKPQDRIEVSRSAGVSGASWQARIIPVTPP